MILAPPHASRLLFIVLGAWAGIPPSLGAEPIEHVQRAAAEWARLRDETVRLEEDWRDQRSLLQAALDALRARVESLSVERDATQARVTQESLEFAQLENRTMAARARLETVSARIDQLAARLEATRPFLPPRLSTALELPFRSIRDPKLGPAERMQHAVTILNRCTAFNRVLTVVEEDLALGPEGARRVLDVVYLGLSHAYALDRANRVAYLGQPTDAGWSWRAHPEAAPAVEQLIAVQREAADPDYLLLPTQVTDPFRASGQH